MLVVLPVSHRDFDGAKRLLEWFNVLQPSYAKHSALIVSSATLDADQAKELYLLAKKCEFHDVNVIRRKLEETSSWPKAPNLMFRDACLWVKTHQRGHWLWCEPDSTPLKEGWLDALEQEYVRGGRPFMGTTYNQPFRHVNGNAVYPQNVDQYNPYMANGPEIPFDTIRAELTLRNCHITELIHHEWGNIQTNTPWTFPDRASLLRINPKALLFHRCKDGTLIDRLEEVRDVVSVNGKEVDQPASIFKRIKSKLTQRKTITVRRSEAFGDALAATCVANKLNERGYKVMFQCVPSVQKIVGLCPNIEVEDPIGACDINLDHAYERHPDKRHKHVADIFIESANKQLVDKHITLEPSNLSPSIAIKDGHKRRFNSRWSDMPRPWIAICPRSNSFNVRTIPDDTWRIAAENISGTKFWLGNHAPAPHGITHLKLLEMYEAAIALSCVDLLVTVDTGPMHIAAALGTPIVAIEQSSSPSVHLTDQRDWCSIKADLDCLNCMEHICPKDAKNPPCQNISPYEIAMAVNQKLRGVTHSEVSAVVPIYRPTADRVNRCLAALIPQVSGIVVTCGGNGRIPDGIIKSAKVTVVKGNDRVIGYGRNLNFGLRHTHGKYVMAVNDDVFLDPDAVEKLMSVMEPDESIGMIGHLLWYPNRKTIQHGGTARGPGDLGWGHIDHRKSSPTIVEPTEMESCTGASVLMRRKAFYDVGAFDERYFLYYEDHDFSLAIRKAGWKIFYTPNAQGIHDEHSSSKTFPEIAKHVRASKAVFTDKWGEYFKWNANRKLGNFDYQRK